MTKQKRTCARCVFDETIPNIAFDKDGVCNFCHQQDMLAEAHSVTKSKLNQDRFDRLIRKIKNEGKGKDYDCVVSVSGGIDSSYTLYMVKKLGLRPIAYHFDNGWGADIAKENMKIVTTRLGVPLKTISYPKQAIMELYVAALKAGIPEICLICSQALYSVLYKAAIDEGLQYSFYGHSPMTEGIYSLKWCYTDARYLNSIVERFAGEEGKKVVKDINKLSIVNTVYYTLIRGIKVIQLPLYLEWNDKKIKETLTKELGWIDGGEHHFDCIFYPMKEFVAMKKVGVNLRRYSLAAMVRSGQISREKALEILREDPTVKHKKSVEVLVKKLGLNKNEFNEFLSRSKDFRDFPTYYSIIKRLKIPIKLLSKLKILPAQTYDKFFEY